MTIWSNSGSLLGEMGAGAPTSVLSGDGRALLCWAPPPHPPAPPALGPMTDGRGGLAFVAWGICARLLLIQESA